MVTINLELWKNPNFPHLDILESRTKVVLEAFNKCRKLDIELQGDDSEIKKFNLLFSSLTEKRAVESSKLSAYSERVVTYIRLLSEETTSTKVIVEVLSSLLSTAQDRYESTNKLKTDYQEFFEYFNNNYVLIKQTNLVDDLNSRQIDIRNQNKPSVEIIQIPEFAALILSFFGAFILWRALESPPKDVITSPSWKRFSMILNFRSTSNKDHSNANGISQFKTTPTVCNEISVPQPPKAMHPYQNPKMRYSQGLSTDRTPAPVPPSETQTFEISLSIEQVTTALSNQHYNQTMMGPVPPFETQTPEISLSIEQATTDLSNQKLISQYMSASIFGIIVISMWTMWAFFYKKKKDQKFKSRKRLDEKFRQKNEKILEIKEKLTVIITNVEILCQFWDNQITGITTNIKTLGSVNENEKIKIPKELAVQIKEYWIKQYNECKKSYIRLKDFVVRNSFLSLNSEESSNRIQR